MSVTTTSNAGFNAVRGVLQDYDLHHSNPQPSDAEAAPAPPPNVDREPLPNNPPGWEDRWRRVPGYRPVQDQRDEQRETYNGEVEHTFIRIMFGGVWLLAKGSEVWRSTINSDYSKFRIGGEW